MPSYPRLYALVGHEVVQMLFMEVLNYTAEQPHADRIVAKTLVGGTEISTIFMGLDHQYGDGPPLLFETMTFGLDGLDGVEQRYSTWAEAEAGHATTVARVRAHLGIPETQIKTRLERLGEDE